MKVGDLVKCNPESRIGIIVDWYVIYDRFGDPIEKLAVVNWGEDSSLEHEYQDMLEVINESR